MIFKTANTSGFIHGRRNTNGTTPTTSAMDIVQQSYEYGESPSNNESKDQPLQIYLFGGRISHSLSPMLHSILFQSVPASWTYNLHETTNPQDFLTVLNRPDSIGASVTMPNKVTFMPYLDHIMEDAQAIGAVNTCFVRLDSKGQRKWIGTNTDCVGIRETLLARDPDLPRKAQGHAGLVIGGGGAARSAIYAVWKWFGTTEIYVVNRIKSEVDAIISSMQQTVPGIKIRHVQTVEEVTTLSSPKIVVGTIPDEMPTSAEEKLAWDISSAFLTTRTSEPGVVLDMCYHPNPYTRLLGLAERNGWTIAYGTDVLVRVSAAQQTLWLERDANPDGVHRALLAVQQPTARI